MLTRLLPALLLSLLAACPSPGGGETGADLAGADLTGADLAAEPDLTGPWDLTGAGECSAPSDCQRLDRAESVRFCPSSAWSCIAGRCTWECHGGRTCELRPGGCLACDGKPAVCPGARCGGLIQSRMPQIDEAFCARGYLMEVEQCFGGVVRLKDGTLCSLETLATALEREVLACGRCQTQILYQ